MARLRQGMCRAGPFRLFSFVTFIATNVICFFLLLMAPSLHPEEKGPLTAQEADSVAFGTVTVLLLPCVALFAVYFTVRGWERRRYPRDDRRYQVS